MKRKKLTKTSIIISNLKNFFLLVYISTNISVHQGLKTCICFKARRGGEAIVSLGELCITPAFRRVLRAQGSYSGTSYDIS